MPNDIFSLSNDLVEALAKLSPISATFWGIPGHDHRWDDLSPQGAEARLALVQDYRRRVEAHLPDLGARVIANSLDEERSWYEHGEHFLDLNNISSTFQSLRQVFDVMDTRTPEGWANIAARLKTIHEPFAGYRATLEAGRASGRVVAKRQVRTVIEQARAFAGDSPFFPTLLRAGEDAVAHARRCFADFADYLEKTYLPSAAESDAVGRDRYLRLSRRFLGMDIDPQETYAWGWSQVREIEAEMKTVAAQIKPGATVPEVIELLKTDHARCAPDVDTFLRLMKERQERALRELDGTHFDIPEPLKKIDVKRAPPGGALGAYYMPPSEDFSRPGTVWYAPGEEVHLPLYDEISTAYHEGFPGHHLQCGLQVYLAEQLTRYHRLAVMYSGYAEGWALYAEHLMNELGYFEKPEYVLGMHVANLMRACRVVVDIGMHLGIDGWDFDRAVDFMKTRAFLPDNHARSEATRYLGWPGQAICYKVGERAILDLRRSWKGGLKQFHARVLGSGSVGLALLREIVRT